MGCDRGLRLGRVKIGEQRGNPGRAGDHAGKASRSGASLGFLEGDIAVGVDKHFRVGLIEERECERQRNALRIVVAQGQRNGFRLVEIECVGPRDNAIRFIEDGNFAGVFANRRLRNG